MGAFGGGDDATSAATPENSVRCLYHETLTAAGLI